MAEFVGTYVGSKANQNRPRDVQPQYAGAAMLYLAERFDAVDMAQNDTMLVGYVPSSAVLVQSVSEVQTTALGASVEMDIGFADDTRPEVRAADNGGVGVTGATAALASDLDVATAATLSMTAAVAVTNRGKKVWQLAGLDRDPGVDLKIIATVKEANPAEGTVFFEQGYMTGPGGVS